MIEVSATPPLNAVHDLGRPGQRHMGVGTCGAMDALALELANMMVGNASRAAGIEVQTYPFELRFLADARFAVTGADCAATLDGRALLPWWQTKAVQGQVLRLNYPSRGLRAYLAFEGGILVPEVLGSRSTDLRSGFGGLEGRFLKRGDRLALGARLAGPLELAAGFGIVPPTVALPGPLGAGQALPIRVLRAGEYERFPAAMHKTFWETDWQVTHQSDRAGYRLSGPPLLLDAHIEMRSYGVVPGLIQVPPGGQPIIQLSDANTAGGYPKFATVIEADLWRLGQARAGSKLRFIDASYQQARQAMQELRDYLAEVRDSMGRQRTPAAGRAVE